MIQSPPRELGREAGPAELRAAVCAAAVSACKEVFGDHLQGIVLTGSLARGEATLVWNFGRWTVLGDAEFFLIFDRRRPLPKPARTESVRRQAEHTLLDQGLRCPIDLSPVHPSYLAQLQPHILAYELKQCGQVVWGDPELLALIPAFSASDIPWEDAWRLLCNRMVEYLAVTPDLLETPASLPPAAFYRTVKLYLDMATSLLVFAGRYEPTYVARAIELRRLVSAPLSGFAFPFDLSAFAERVELCTGFKRQQPGYRDLSAGRFAGEEGIRFWRDAVEYAHRLWRWELCLLTHVGQGLSDRELMREWMARQPMMRRLRGWARVFRDSDWRLKCTAWPRWIWLGRRASPRHWVYAAAAEIFFRLPALMASSEKIGNFNSASVCRWLPSPRPRRPAASDPPWVRAGWAVYWNYQRFVAVTRA